MNAPLLIHEYNPKWKVDFEEIERILQSVLGEEIISIEHIGSTAVPGLAAKPIIDIDIVYENDSTFGNIKDGLATLGYRHEGDLGIPEREAFKRNKKEVDFPPVLDKIMHHLYACPVDSNELRKHILFRDFMRKNDQARKEYQQLKFELASEANQNRKIYAALKEKKARAFILSVLEKANQVNIEMKNSLILREIRESDCEIISAVFNEQGWTKPVSQYREYLEYQERGERDIIVATLDESFAGYLTINWKSDYAPFREKEIPEIVDLNVPRKYHRKGIATAMMDEAENRMKKVSSFAGIGFGVTQDYGAAQVLYINRGYKPDGRGLCKNGIPVKHRETIEIDDDVAFYLIKDLT